MGVRISFYLLFLLKYPALISKIHHITQHHHKLSLAGSLSAAPFNVRANHFIRRGRPKCPRNPDPMPVQKNPNRTPPGSPYSSDPRR